MFGKYIDLGNPVASHPLNDGLVGWWMGLPNNSGGSTLFDLLGKNHGTLTGGTSWGSGVGGLPAVGYNGSDYVELNAAQLLGGTSSPFTVEFDCYMGDSNGNALATLNYGGAGLFFGYVNINGNYQGWSLGDSSWQPQQDGRSGLVAGRYHVVFTYNGSGVGSTANYGIYQNAVAGTVANAGAYGGNGAVSRLGYHVGADDWLGTIYSTRVYNRALSADEVGRLYEQSLVGYPHTLRRYSKRIWLSDSSGGGGAVTGPFPYYIRRWMTGGMPVWSL